MTVSTLNLKATGTGNGVATVLPFNFKIFSKSDLVVTVQDLGGHETTLPLDLAYTVTGMGEEAGSVVLVEPLADGWAYTIERVLPLTQESSLENQGAQFNKVFERGLDRHTMALQQLQAQIDRLGTGGLSLPMDVIPQVLGYLASPVTGRGSAMMSYNAPFTGGAARALNDKLGETLSLLDCGGSGDGVTDNAPALARALTRLGASGGTIRLPKNPDGTPGVYRFSTLDLHGKYYITLEGSGNRTGGGTPASSIMISGSGLINLDAATSIQFRRLKITGDDTSAVGPLISATALANNISFEDCIVVVPTVGYSRGCLLDLDFAYICKFTRTSFSGGTHCVRGQHSDATPANAIHFDGCEFVNYGVSAILDSGTNWIFDGGCAFEPNWTTGVHAVYRFTPGVHGQGIAWRNCWIGDIQTAGGTLFEWSGSSLVIEDNWIDIHECTLLKVTENNCYGISVQKNRLVTFGSGGTLMNFGSTTGHGYVILETAVDNLSGVTKVTGTVPGGIIVRDSNISGVNSADPHASGFGQFFDCTVGISKSATIGAAGLSSVTLALASAGNCFVAGYVGGRATATWQMIMGTSAMAIVRYDAAGTVINTPISIGANSGNPVTFDAPLAFLADNAYDLGSGSFRARVIYAGTGSINTSDAREKEQVAPIPDAWLDAWGEVEFVHFKWISSVAEKGDEARWHCGVIAQRVEDAFRRHGLDARALGVLCYDEWPYSLEEWPDEYRTWDEEWEEWPDTYDSKGNLVMPAGRRLKREAGRELLRPAGRREIQAGNRYGVRYDEAYALECAYQRREIARLKAAMAG